MSKVHDKARALTLLAAFMLGWTLVVPSFPASASGQTTTTTTTGARRRTARKVTRPAQPTSASGATATRNSSSAATNAPQQPTRVPQLPAQQPQQPTPQPTRTPDAVRPPVGELGPPPKPVNEGSTDKPGEEIIVDEDEVVRVTSNLVVVPVSVTDERGEPVQGLKAADFRLEEEGRVQEVAQVGDAEQVPLDIAILFDVSSSVTSKNFFTFQQESAARFLRQVLKPADRAAVFSFGQKITLEQPLAPAETAAAKVLSIPAATVATGTAFYDAVTQAAKYLSTNSTGRHRRVIVVLSDGDDTFSERVREVVHANPRAYIDSKAIPPTARERLQEGHRQATLGVQREVQRGDIVFYSINPGGPSVRLNQISMRAQNGMQQVAESTGGTAFVPDRLELLDSVLRQIAAELRAQYLLQYYSNSDAPNGKFLSIRVRTPARPAARVRSRTGYYVKK
jgi:Ca-activated chloride channel family protein